MELLQMKNNSIWNEKYTILARINSRLDTAEEQINIRRHSNKHYQGNRKGGKTEKN